MHVASHAWGAWEVAASRESVIDGRGVRWMIRAVLLWHAVSEPYAWPESGTRVVVGGWDRRCVREGLGKYRYICGATSTYAVARTCGQRGERTEAIDARGLTRMGRDVRGAREVAASRE